MFAIKLLQQHRHSLHLSFTHTPDFDSRVAYVVSKFGSAALKHKYLPSLTSLESLASYCLTEPGSGSDAASLTTTALPVEGGWLISGSKAFISGAGASDVYLVMARCKVRGQGARAPPA